MARVTFKKEQQQELRGTFCGMVFKNRCGKQFMYQQQQPVLVKKATKEQKAKYEKDCMIQRCVEHIQRSIYEQGKPSVARMQQVADKFHAIKKACERMYDDFLPVFRKNNRMGKLEMAINYWYLYKKMLPQIAFDYAVTQMEPGSIKVTRASASPHRKHSVGLRRGPQTSCRTSTRQKSDKPSVMDR